MQPAKERCCVPQYHVSRPPCVQWSFLVSFFCSVIQQVLHVSKEPQCKCEHTPPSWFFITSCNEWGYIVSTCYTRRKTILEFKPLTLNSFVTIMAFFRTLYSDLCPVTITFKELFCFFFQCSQGRSRAVSSELPWNRGLVLNCLPSWPILVDSNWMFPQIKVKVFVLRWKTLPLRRFFNCAPPVYSKLGSPIMQMTHNADERKKFWVVWGV